jgi:tyrosyl-tRNA synthetase
MQNFIEELTWRGMLHDVMPGTEEQLKKEMTPGYIGFDPTASSLHIGHLTMVMLLVHFQRAGHKPVALIGGATGMIGDPSGKSAEREFLSEEALRNNQETTRRQLEKFLDFSSCANAAEIVNNYDWFREMGFLQFLREVGKHLTVNYMMAKDSVKKRLETGISFTEFSYQLLQGYDFYHLFKTKGIRLQMGGSDQWGNITAGTELIRRKAGGDAFALTAPLLTKADGAKFGKSEGGNVWLDPTMTSPYKFYQFWRTVADQEIPKLLRVFTLFGREQIEALESDPNPNNAKMALAQEITTRVHGAEATQKAIGASNLLFGKSTLDELQSIDEATLLEVCEGVPQIQISKDTLGSATDVTELLSTVTDSQIFPSKGEARKMIQGGGIRVNKVKVEKPDQPADFPLIQGKFLLIQKGAKNYYLLSVL